MKKYNLRFDIRFGTKVYEEYKATNITKEDIVDLMDAAHEGKRFFITTANSVPANTVVNFTNPNISSVFFYEPEEIEQ